MTIEPKKPRTKRVLWLQTQPEHYFNCMMDDLQRASPGDLEYVAAFSYAGPGWYQNNAPAVAPSLLLTPRPGVKAPPAMRQRFHENWRRELLSLDIDAAIVSGYGYRTHREFIRACAQRRIPVAMFSDSNLRSQRGRGLKNRGRRWIKKRLLRPYIRDVAWLLTANRLGVAYWRYFGAPADKIVLCPYYADYPRAAAAAGIPREQVLQRVALRPEDRYFFTAARLVPAKGIDLMIHAFRQLNLAAHRWHYIIAGVGPQESHLKAMAADLSANIHFVGFQQPADNLALMAHAEAMVLPSRYEPHGIVIQEAASMGVPVLASDVCGAAADLVTPGVSGALFRSGDIKDLTARLRSITTDPSPLSQMRTGAREVFESWFRRTNPVRIADDIARRMLGIPPAERTAS
ncbi:MAG TPA: glycosyltransferase family 4 protein [Phycisphaerae bacterium]|nr:glycosyltransferase family 4 protein [Phycisphaerae bacterium]